MAAKFWMLVAGAVMIIAWLNLRCGQRARLLARTLLSLLSSASSA